MIDNDWNCGCRLQQDVKTGEIAAIGFDLLFGVVGVSPLVI